MEVTSGFKQTEAGVIPEDWDVRNLQDLISIKGGLAFSSAHFSDNGPILLTPGNFRLDGRLYFNDRNTKRYSGQYPNSAVFDCGDLLVVMTDLTPDCDLLGKPAFVTLHEPVLHNQRIGKVVPISGRISLAFLYWHFLSYPHATWMKATATGSTVRHTSNRSIYGGSIALPPTKAEQEAVAAALSDADALIDALKDLLTKKRNIKQGATQELLTGKKRLPGFEAKLGLKQTEVGVIPEDWDVRKLHTVVRFHNSGIYKNQTLYGHGDNIVGVSDIYGIGKVDGQIFANVPLSSQERVKHTLQPNDLLYGESSLVREGIARTVYVTERGAGTAFAWHTRRYSIERRALTSQFLYYYLQSRPARAHMINHSIQTALTGINTAAYFQCPVIVPPVVEQKAIADILSDMDDEIDTVETKLTKARHLKQGMMQELLTGRIRLV
jgi:type I restriction enzyme S subunit